VSNLLTYQYINVEGVNREEQLVSHVDKEMNVVLVRVGNSAFSPSLWNILEAFLVLHLTPVNLRRQVTNLHDALAET
jgi:hypothetical protein